MVKNPILIALLLLAFAQLTLSYGCGDQIIEYRCNGRYDYPYNWNYAGSWDTNQCWENDGGTFVSCSNPGGGYYYIGTNSGWSDTIYMYRQCHSYCSACTSTGCGNSCTSCNSPYNKWQRTNRCCQTYCPSRGTGHGTSRGQYATSDNTCGYCHSYCSWCTSGGAVSACLTCRPSYYLIDDPGTCTSRWTISDPATGTSYGPEHTCYSRQCLTSCPTKYYFEVAQSSTTNGRYSSWTAGATYTSQSGSNQYYRRLTNICYYCHAYCEECWNSYNTQCYKCSRFHWMWEQQNNRCEKYCPTGSFNGGSGDWRGQYIQASTSNNSASGQYRQCQLCDANCVWCKDSSSNCFWCKDNSTLMDISAQCQARFTCAECNHNTLDGCIHNDNYCRSGDCPTYFYFQIFRERSDELGVKNSIYNTYTQGASETEYHIGTTPRNYRKETDFCMLCDFRCMKCDGPRNTNCSQCINGYYLWTNDSVCDEVCPPGQYNLAQDQSYPGNQTLCYSCMSRCQLCAYRDQNCSRCVGHNYDYLNSSAGFLYAYTDSNSTCLQTCPASSNPLTDVGWYGSIKTMVCYQCPDPCSNCNIDIMRIAYPILDCGSDQLCLQGLVCTSCLANYALAGGQCIPQNSCRQYAYFQPLSSSTQWSADNCECLSGHSSTSYAACNIRCHEYCKTCSGTGSTNCLSCEDGFYLSGTSCVANNAGWSKWVYGEGVSGGSKSDNGHNYGCGSFTSVFGYRDFTANKWHQLSLNTLTTNYYAISVRMTMVFIDEWPQAGTVFVHRDSQATSNIVWSWAYDDKDAYGEQLCGTNKMDYIIRVNAQFPTRNTTSQNIYITTNQDKLNTATGVYYHYGIRGVVITGLKCHGDCATCTGPDNTDCLTCSDSAKSLYNGLCQCKNASNYWYQPGTSSCGGGCPANYYKDEATVSCVLPTACTAPKRFGSPANGYCVETCPNTYYATNKTMLCTTDCWGNSLSQYKYDGAQRTCEDPCPNGYIADPSTRKCVNVCPSNWFLMLQNRDTAPTCTDNCPTGWEYTQLQECVVDCPNGYFKQTLSGHNKCVATCTNAFGDNTTNSCVTQCPFPTYADISSRLCVDTCPSSYQYMQVAVSDLNRTCVSTCENGQYSNPYTFKCSNYTTDCPDGFFADSHTNQCERTCTQNGQVGQNTTRACQSSCTTGFAYWTNKICVDICPTNPSMFARTDIKECVSSCNFASTGLFGDEQANRTCVDTCASTPVATFGQNATSLCVQKCTRSNEYGDPLHSRRFCVTRCVSSPAQTYAYSVTKLCVQTCPDTYFGDHYSTSGHGVCSQSCPSPYFGEPDSHLCRICRWGQYGYPVGNRPCLYTCPYDWFGTGRQCVQSCPSGTYADKQTNLCLTDKKTCSNSTYGDFAKAQCVINTNCTEGTFANPISRGCETFCPDGYIKDDNINTCVEMCSDSPDEYNQWGACTSACVLEYFADFQANRTCMKNCSTDPILLYGNQNTKRCVEPFDCPANHYGHNSTHRCQNPCSGSFPYGDPTTRQCVLDCPDTYYGDSNTNLCVQVCDFSTYHYADNQTGNCQTLCTLGTFGVNETGSDHVPSCEYDCPVNSYARDSDRICVADCQSGLYGDPIKGKCYADPFECSDGYYANSVNNLCVLPANCQTVGTHYFGQNQTKTCVQKCDEPNYGDSATWTCQAQCNTTFYGQNTTRLCLSGCATYSSFAQSQNHLCVAGCSHIPISHFADTVNHVCVEAINCPTSPAVSYAQNTSRSCMTACPANEWADADTKRCVQVCPDRYYADDSTGNNLCSSSCPGTYRFRDNSSVSCVDICPIANQTFGDTVGDQCVHTCPENYFAQVDTNRRCVLVCKAGTWGNPVTRVCITDPLNQCPTNTWADNSTNLCTGVCSSSSGYYGNNITKMCVTACPDPSFAFDGSRVCIDICPPSLDDSGYFGDPDTTPTRKCFQTCQTADRYRDVAASRTCVTDCTFNSTYKTYRDPTTMSCQPHCSTYPQFRYANDDTKTCQLSCAGSLRKDDSTRSCVSSCPNLYDPTTDRCVDACPRYSTSGHLFADLTTKDCVVGSSCPSGTFIDYDSNTCATTCPNGTYYYQTECVYHCPHDYFMDESTQSCVSAMSCPSGQYADNQTRSCVTQCIGTFAKTDIKRCIDVCYSNTYGDPFTFKCQATCSNGLFINVDNSTCQSNCAIGMFENPVNQSCSSTCPSPYYADNHTRSCVSVCSANPIKFAQSSSGNRLCVSTCASSQMHDMMNRECVTTCPTNTFSYTVNMSCVNFCPSPYYELGTACVLNCSSENKYSDDTTRQCVATCPTGYYKDEDTFKCVVDCPTSPNLHYISESEGKCVENCPEGTYADKQERKCVSSCSQSPPTFAEENNNLCVEVCPLSANSFADESSFTCVTTCPANHFADSRDRTCVRNCSILFADSQTIPPACVSTCTDGTFADQLTFTCVSSCPTTYYSHTPTKTCVQFCPHGYFADDTTGSCVVAVLCPTSQPYADTLIHYCVTNCSADQYSYIPTGATFGGQCLYYCPSGYFANPNSLSCETSCPSGLFAQTTNNTCAESCPDDKFMDSVNNQCVSQCPAANSLFGNTFNHSCLTECDPTEFTYADTLTRLCERTCTGTQFADDSTQTCVGPTGCPSHQYSDPHYKKCVDVCYNNTYGYQGQCLAECPTASDDVYANNETRTCTAATSCPNNTYADPVLKKCVQFCPIESATYADDATQKCVFNCLSPLYADNTTRRCVDICPNVSQLFGYNTTRKCVENCPYPSFADSNINLCVSNCPFGEYADQSTLKCVTQCPQGKFGNNLTNYCVDTCPNNYYGDPISRDCVLDCPAGYFADPDYNRRCEKKCVGSTTTYAENSTGTCLGSCLTGYSNPRTQQCIAVCTSGYYGYNKICYTQCPTVTPTVFADDSTNLCVQTCPNATYGDLSTLKCVQICPISQGSFANDENQQCTTSCPNNYFADQSTRRCVAQCPSVPALYGYQPTRLCLSECIFGHYADNSTRLCKSSCPDGTYADSSTMKCVWTCPTKPLTFGLNVTNQCVTTCPSDRNMYADNFTRICVLHCSVTDSTFADPVSQTCVSTCPDNYYQVNSTRTCEVGCPNNQFADPLLRICVARCSNDPIYYGDPVSWTCMTQCPTGSYGDPLTQQCVYGVGSASGCAYNYYSDPTTQLCVEVCPMKQDLYGDPSTKHCEATCTNGYFADNSTMRCVQTCPTYPSYFANLVTLRCIPFCPDGTFADDVSRQCVSQCPSNSYAESSTNRCVKRCQQQPLTYADDTTWSCVAVCPDGYFADNSTGTCVSQCPDNENTYAQNTTKMCVRVCPLNSYADVDKKKCVSQCYGTNFADDSSNRCVSVCPKYPAYYADSTTNKCVAQCPPNYFAYEQARTCVDECPTTDLFRQNSTRTCVSSCDLTENTYADNQTKYCVFRCTVNSFADPTTHRCVAICPDQPLMYADDSTQTCVSVCPGVTYGDNTTRSCVGTCPAESLSLPQKNLCVRYCPIGYFAYYQTAFCLLQCPSPYYGDPSTRSCVDNCPISQLLYADDVSRECVTNCPDSSYADKKSVTCIDVCPDAVGLEAQTYAADYNNVCVEECALPYFAYLPNKKCLNQCPDPYYNNVTDHKCHLCPTVCDACTSLTSCTSCVSTYYLEDGACVSQCSTNYYANDATMTCVSSISCNPKFGVNDTHTCQSSCPVGSFGNTAHYRCDACPETCTECVSWTKCTVCENQTQFGDDYCYPYCTRNLTGNSSVIYYDVDNATCLQSCRDGTFLALLFCNPCSSECQKCVGNSTFCTLCSKGLYLKNQVCQSSCGDQYKPNQQRQCIFCGQDCGTSLTFETNHTQINGQNNIFITFSDNVTLNGDVNDIIGLQTINRRLLTSGRLLQANYRIQIIDSKTIKIVILDDDASNYEVQILQPENIADVFGNIPSKVRDQIQMDLSNTYTTTLETAPSGFSTYFAILSIVCVISFLFDIQFMKFQQLLFIHYFVAMTLPPQLSKVLIAFRYSTLYYLPTMYNVPTAVLKDTVPGKVYDVIGDYSFLRNAGFAFTPLAVIVFVWIIMKILTVPEINRFKNFRIWCTDTLEEKFKFAVLFEWLSIMFLNTVFFSFMQMRDYNMLDTFTQASIVFAHITLFFILIMFIYLVYRVISFFREHPKLSSNIKKASQLILQENEYHKLNSTNIFLFEMKKIDLRNIMYPKINNENILPFRIIYRFGFLPLACLIFTYIRAIVICIIIAFAKDSTLLALGLCIPLNVLFLLYLSRARPYSFKYKKKRFRNYIAIFNEVSLLMFEFLMVALAILDRDQKTAFEKESFSYVIIYFLTIVCTINFIYFVFRTWVQAYRKIYMPFTQTDLFRENFPEKYEQLHGNKKKNLLKGVDPKAKQALKSLIKGYKYHKSALRPNQKDKENPQLPMKYKITYFDRDTSSIGSRSSMTKAQRRRMLKDIFHGGEDQSMMEKEDMKQYQEVVSESERTDADFEQYEEQIEIKAKDLAKYVKNAQQLLRIKRMKEEDE